MVFLWTESTGSDTIESVTVLKDAAASAIYGARAANGVIVVKTKRGTPGKISISYNGYAGFQQATYLPEFVNAADYMQMVNVANANVGGAPIYLKKQLMRRGAIRILSNIRIQIGPTICIRPV